jgi:hypothetical protein
MLSNVITALAVQALVASPSMPAHSDTVRICLAPAQVEGSTGNSQQAADAVRATFSSFLTGPSVSVTPLTSRLDSQAREEAHAAGCPHVLFTTLKLVHKTGGGSMFGKVAAGAADVGASVASSSIGNPTARAATSTAAYGVDAAVRQMSSSVKAKDEMTLEYRLEGSDGRTEVADKDKRTASADGEDLLTPAARKASEAVVTVTMKGSK